MTRPYDGGRGVVEAPIPFADRRLGESKMGLAAGLRYLAHLRRLFAYKSFGRRRARP